MKGNIDEIIKALRCTSDDTGRHGDCSCCPYKDEWDTVIGCDVEGIEMDAAELLESLKPKPKRQPAKECKCWAEYPNECQKKRSGIWKCVDIYDNVSNYTNSRKTFCRLKEEEKE